eukprot:TRINITY_DN73247_c0_g1_i1.p1 TRINITY_DN73247_c0_g1~~TRINITY_DN73247_c0_g1_i1.p1  ORF type:complete len:130 (+),score=25.12 TRINITY_DN73247_c0_g1_i1:78-467(+)
MPTGISAATASSLPASFQADAGGSVMNMGGVPFMCYKVQRIAKLAQPPPTGANPLLLTLPPVPTEQGAEESSMASAAAVAPSSQQSYGVWPGASPGEAQLAWDILRIGSSAFAKSRRRTKPHHCGSTFL